LSSEYDGERTMEDLAGDAEREAVKHKAARDKYSRQAQVLIDKRNQLQDKAKRLSSEARYMRDRRDDYNLSASEARGKRDEWNDRANTMRARGGLGDIGEARSQSSNYHQKAVKFSNSGQLAHEKMKQLQEEANALREQAQVYHEQAMELRKAADAEHELYIKAKRKAQMIRESPQRSPVGSPLRGHDVLDDAERDPGLDGDVQIGHPLVEPLEDRALDGVVDLHGLPGPLCERYVEVPFRRGALGAAAGLGHGPGRPGVAAPQAVVDPRRDVPLVGSALGAPLRVSVVGVPGIIAPLAGDGEVRHVPLDGSATGAPVGLAVPPGNPNIRASGALQNPVRLICQTPHSSMKFRL
jgi:hypothetical protein